MQQKPPRRLVVANVIGSLGYLSLLLEWAWVALLFIYPLAEKGEFSWFLPDAPITMAPPPAPIVMTPFTTTLVAITVILCLVATVYALLKLPVTVGRTGARVTHIGAEAVIPRLTGHKKLSRSRIRRLSFRIIIGIKAILIILPVALTLLLPAAPALSRNITWIIVVFLAFWPLLYFGIQTLLMRLFKLDPTLVW